MPYNDPERKRQNDHARHVRLQEAREARDLARTQNLDPSIDYRDIPGFPGYCVGADGSVWTCWRHNGHQARRLSPIWKRLVPTPQKNGYLHVKLYRQSKAYTDGVHELVLRSFLGPCPPGMESCHNNGNPADCALENLRWDTHANNLRDRWTHGTAPMGERSGNARLTAPQVLEIKRALATGEPATTIAPRYGVRPKTVQAIKQGRLWAWLTLP